MLVVISILNMFIKDMMKKRFKVSKTTDWLAECETADWQVNSETTDWLTDK